MRAHAIPAAHAEILERENERQLRNMLETVAGERCPCGHLASDHRTSRSNVGMPAGLRRMLGACHTCECQGLIEPDSEEAPDAA